MATEENILPNFRGFNDEWDLGDERNRCLFADYAKQWIDGVLYKCQKVCHMSKPQTFDTVVGLFSDETKSWFNQEFTDTEKNRTKNLKTLITKFNNRYVKLLDPIPSKLQKTLDLLVDRIMKLKPFEKRVEEQEKLLFEQSVSFLKFKAMHELKFEQLQDRVLNLESAVATSGRQNSTSGALEDRISILEEKLAKAQLSKCDGMKSMRDKQDHLKKEIAALTPVLQAETPAIQSQVQTIEADCAAHKRLLDHLQKQLTEVVDREQRLSVWCRHLRLNPHYKSLVQK